MGGEPGVEAFGHAFSVRRDEMLVGEDQDAGLQRRLARLQPSDLRALPNDPPSGGERNGLVGRAGERIGARCKLGRQDLRGGMARRLAVDAVTRRIGGKAEAVEMTDKVVLDKNLTVRADLGHHLLLIA